MARQSMILVASWRGRSVSSVPGLDPRSWVWVSCLRSPRMTPWRRCVRAGVVCRPHPNVRNAEGLSSGNAGLPLPRPNAPALNGEERAGVGVI